MPLERIVMSMLRGINFGMVVCCLAGVSLVQGCSKEGTSSQLQRSGEVSTHVGGADTLGSAIATDTDTQNKTILADWQKMRAAADECCNLPGQADECWEQDVLSEKGHVACEDDGDCATGQTCDLSLAGEDYGGRCTCTTQADCLDTASEGGVCDVETNVCGPSWCNGYYICSCWGGCVWWDGYDADNTPADDAIIVDMTCCEGDYGSGGSHKFFGSLGCGDPDSDTLNVIASCVSDADCVDANPCTQETCDTDAGICDYLIITSTLCELDGLGCTIDRCDANGDCRYSGDACPPDSYMAGASAVPNTCTLDCVEDPSDIDGDSILYQCGSPLSVPEDTDVKDVDGACERWTCVPSGSTVIPDTEARDCSGVVDACNTYTCDPSGDSDNCDIPTMTVDTSCDASDMSNLCLYGKCMDIDGDGAASCEDMDVEPTIGDTDTTDCATIACIPTTGWTVVVDSDSIGSGCNDSDACTTGETCSATGNCNGGAVTVCDGGDCATEICNSVSGACDVAAYEGTDFDCNDGITISGCTFGKCDGAGACVEQTVPCMSTPEVCNQRVCYLSQGCVDIADPSLTGTTAQCEDTKAPNCEIPCDEVTHPNTTLDAAGYVYGECEMALSTAINDDCSNPLHLGDFVDANPSGTRLAQYGSTECATNSYQSIGANCLEYISSSNHGAGTDRMGYDSPDVVYSFSYVATGNSYPKTRYKVQLDSMRDNGVDDGYDGAVYVTTDISGACPPATASVTDVASHDCVPNGSPGISTHEDRCYDPVYNTGCARIEPDNSDYSWIAGSTVYEDTTVSAGTVVTVYVFVDGNTEYSVGKSEGKFYLSVTKETGCPDVRTWYSGKVHTTIDGFSNTFAVPINGTDFSGVVPSPAEQSGSFGTSPAVLLSGDTRLASNDYTYVDAGDADFSAWAGNDEMWELDIQADGVSFNASLCDYGGHSNDSDAMPFNPMLAVFNCYGERLDYNDDSVDCGGEMPQISPVSPTVMDDGPYYLMVDGYYEPGVTGKSNGYSYDLSVYYISAKPTVVCDSLDTDPLTIAVTLPVPGADVGPMTYYPSGCLTASAGTWNQNAIEVKSNGTVPGSQCCDSNSCSDPMSGRCFPIYIMYDVFYKSVSTGERCVNSGYVMQYDRHGNTVIPASIPTPQYYPACGADYLFDGLNVGFQHPGTLSATERGWCESNCGLTQNFYLRNAGGTW